jgi:hypothetical protein
MVAAAFMALITVNTRVAAAASTASEATGTRLHFIGTEKLFADPGAAKLKEAWQKFGTVALRNAVLDRCARLPFAAASNVVAKGSTDQGPTFRPLLDDLLQNEFYLDAPAAGGITVAVQLPEARAKAWDANLRQAVGAWKLGAAEPLKANGFDGWQAGAKGKPASIRAGRAGSWFLVSAGVARTDVEDGLVAAIKADGRPATGTGAWLDGVLNVASLAKALPALGGFQNLPVAHFSLSNRADFVRTLAKLDFSKPHQWKPEPWRMPTNFIHDPLVSFVAARGIEPVLSGVPEIRQLGWNPTPNQLCGWGLGGLPFQFFYTLPSRDISNQMHKVEPKLNSLIFGRNPHLQGRLAWETNHLGLFWQGLPMASPKMRPLGAGSEFLALQMFPLAGSRTPAPKELFDQLSRDNLVYYDWELTKERMPHWRQFYQLAEIATRRMLSPTNVAANRFVVDIAPLLDECATEIVATSPTQMTLTRKSTVGLSAVELITLSRWLESTAFPEFGIFLPAPAAKRPAPRQPGK